MRTLFFPWSRPGRGAAMAVLAATLLIAAPAQARDCVLSALEGARAELWLDGSWRAVRPADLPLALPPVAAILRTGPDARLALRCDDGVEVTLGASSELNLGSLTEYSREGVVLRLIQGVVGAVADGAWRRFEIRSPLAIAAVRSTRWLVSHDREEGSAVFVAAGAVAVRPVDGAGAAVLEAGEGVDLPPDGSMSPVRTWGAARVEAARARLGHGWR